ncbi:hypothetical protein [Halobacterium zhouii]|uniref:hypothetical protein n=1 Tax=Halobacterium zhouii TaxID=2902624 RepID=UPI001E3FD365|nr:hypothetical protein [Halobacterium zhouii]
MSKAVAFAVVIVASLVAGPLAGGVLADSAQSEGSSAGPAVASTDVPSARSATPTIEQSMRLHLTPSEPGRVGVTVTYDVPSELTALVVRLPDRATDVTSESFTETDSGYEWDGSTDPATLRFSMAANRSSDSPRATSTQGSYSFVDAGAWALVTVPQLGTEWRWRDARNVTLASSVSVAGAGTTGGEVAYLGPVETHTRTAHEQTFTLAVPERASMAESPAEVFDALAAASDQMRVGERDPNVWLVAAPNDVRWVARGVEYGGSDLWVVADAELDDPGNVWIHEYVHTRQDYTTTASGRWTVEAVADYYAALLTLEQGRIGFDSFSDYLGRGAEAPWADSVLARPGTWEYGADYVKGSLVWGDLDRRVRLATNSSHSMMEVFSRLNQHDGEVSNDDVLAAVAAAASEQVATVGERYTETRRAPEMWSRFEHWRAFDTEPAQMEYDSVEYRVTGPFRTASFDSLPALYVGETLVVTANVTNTGGADGEYAATLGLDGDVLAVTNGTLRPSESATVTLRHEFGEAGAYNVSLGPGSTGAVVERPAKPQVSNVSLSGTNDGDGQVTVTATLSSPNATPAAGPVAVTVDGETVASLEATLAAGESVTRRVTVSVPTEGEYTVAVGNQTARSSEDDQSSGTSMPGFGVGVSVAALVLAGLVAVAASAAGRER